MSNNLCECLLCRRCVGGSVSSCFQRNAPLSVNRGIHSKVMVSLSTIFVILRLARQLAGSERAGSG